MSLEFRINLFPFFGDCLGHSRKANLVGNVRVLLFLENLFALVLKKEIVRSQTLAGLFEKDHVGSSSNRIFWFLQRNMRMIVRRRDHRWFGMISGKVRVKQRGQILGTSRIAVAVVAIIVVTGEVHGERQNKRELVCAFR